MEPIPLTHSRFYSDGDFEISLSSLQAAAFLEERLFEYPYLVDLFPDAFVASFKDDVQDNLTVTSQPHR